jgi:hypothetical protein
MSIKALKAGIQEADALINYESKYASTSFIPLPLLGFRFDCTRFCSLLHSLLHPLLRLFRLYLLLRFCCSASALIVPLLLSAAPTNTSLVPDSVRIAA